MKIRSLYKGKILNENDIQKNTHFQTRMSQAVKYENEIHLVSNSVGAPDFFFTEPEPRSLL